VNCMRLPAFLILAAMLSLTACGKKGDPIRPGEEAQLEERGLFE
jgi:hypothetical protein